MKNTNVDQIALIAAISTYNAIKKTAQKSEDPRYTAQANRTAQAFALLDINSANLSGGRNGINNGVLEIHTANSSTANNVVNKLPTVTSKLLPLGVSKVMLSCENTPANGVWLFDISSKQWNKA